MENEHKAPSFYTAEVVECPRCKRKVNMIEFRSDGSKHCPACAFRLPDGR